MLFNPSPFNHGLSRLTKYPIAQEDYILSVIQMSPERHSRFSYEMICCFPVERFLFFIFYGRRSAPYQPIKE